MNKTDATPATDAAHSIGLDRELVEPSSTGCEKKHQRQELIHVFREPILILDADDGVVVDANQPATDLFQIQRDRLIGMSQSELVPGELVSLADEIFTQNALTERAETSTHILTSGGSEIPVSIQTTALWVDSRPSWIIAVIRERPDDGRDGSGEDLKQLVRQLKHRSADLEAAQQRIVELSCRAGLAEVATGVLHNVGNVLNSINVAASLVRDLVRKSKVDRLSRLADLLEQHADDLGTFLNADAKGKHIPTYVRQLANALEKERNEVLAQVYELAQNVEHVKSIVALQQTYARMGGVQELCSLPEVVDDAIRINMAGLKRHGATIETDSDDIPAVNIDKQKILHILVNLISNAKYALDGTDLPNPLIRVQMKRQADDQLRIEVADNGIGIAKEHIDRVFEYGFTTRSDGHGFGLHSARKAAKELGGTLAVQSEGPDQGATFALTIPLELGKPDDG